MALTPINAKIYFQKNKFNLLSPLKAKNNSLIRPERETVSDRGRIFSNQGVIFNRHATRICREDLSWAEFGELLKSKYENPDSVNFVIYGCSTGEEAYSMAILLNEIYEGRDFKIGAFDISDEIISNNIKEQRKGKSLNSFEIQRIKKSLDTENERNYTETDSHGQIKIKKEIADKILFSPSNILTDTHFLNSKAPVVLMCRNMWPYINPREYDDFAKKLRKYLHPDSIVVLGDFDYEGEIGYKNSGTFPDTLIQNGFKYVLYSRFQAENSRSLVFEPV